MRFEEFKDAVINKLQDFYGADAKVVVQRVEKLNGSGYDGLSIYKTGEEGMPTPVISLNEFFDEYGDKDDCVDECIDRIVSIFENNTAQLPQGKSFEEIIGWENVKERIYPALISKKENKELLKKLVTTDFLDLSVIYVIRVVELKAGLGHVKISKELLKRWGIETEMLHKQALYNLRRDGYGFEDIENILMDMLQMGAAHDSEVDHFEDGKIYVYSNSGKVFGAAGILDEASLAERLGKDSYYILPSSIHETLFVRKESGDKKELADIVREVNQTQVEVCDRLSDRIYVYNGKTGKVELCA